MSSKNYYKKMDIFRIILCVVVLLYHFNVLKGGYLAVCSFLTISGYLLTKSILNKENFSLKEHYKKRIKRLYFPLLLVVFLTIIIVPHIKNIYWFNLKPETKSVLLNYNNFWQINANQDYFARSIESPFVHMWYISLLLQLELILPLFIKLIQKIKNKKIQTLIMLIISIISTIYFYKISIKNNMTITYYNTLTRMFSYIYGITLAFIHKNYKKDYKKNNILYFIYLIILTILFITIKPSSQYFNTSMILTSLITLRIINYSLTNTKENPLIKKLSHITYEIYLLQYPIMYIFNYIEMDKIIKIILILLFIILLSKLIYLVVNTKKHKIIKAIIVIPILLLGIFTYIKEKDHTDEMNNLKLQLEQNEELLKKMENNYNQNVQEEEQKLKEALENINISSEDLRKLVLDMPLVGIGDSVMLGASFEIKNTFKNSYVDAKVSRSIWKAEEVINQLKEKNLLGNPVIIHLGTNGDSTKLYKEEIMKILQNKKVFWINTTNLINVNNNLNKLAEETENLEIIDWYNISRNHKEYFYADGIHLTPVGRKAYTNAIYEAVYNNYQKENQIKKANILKEYEETKQNKITFYGNEMLLNALNTISEEYKDANIYIENNITFNELKQKIQESKENKTITNKIILIFDKTFDINEKQYNELKELYSDKQIYLITTNKINQTLHIEEKYIMPDGIHLSEEGNKKLFELLKNI